ncbi:NACHT domain-containing protein, partial [Streptomyces sp. YC504]|nr:NACHT domain-containing protein [Streptomyces mesophilus]
HYPQPPRWTADQATRTFTFLAHYLHTHQGGSPDIAWWHFSHAVPAYMYRLMLGLAFGLVTGLTSGLGLGLTFGLADGLTTGLTVGLTAGLMVGPMIGLILGLAGILEGGPSSRASIPARRLRLSPNSLVVGLALGLVSGLAGGVMGGLALGLPLGLVGGLVGSLRTEPADLTTAIGPTALLTRDRRTFFTAALSVGIAFALPVGLTFGPAMGFAVGPVVGLVFGLEWSAWATFVVAWIYLAARRQVPWRLTAFLQDAHEQRGVLRQVGAAYQFRHIDLQHHLAHQPRPPAS